MVARRETFVDSTVSVENLFDKSIKFSMERKYSATQQHLVEFKQGFVYHENIVNTLLYKIADDFVKHEAAGKCQTCGREQILRFVKAELKCYCKGNRRLF